MSAAGQHRALRIGLTGPIGCGKSTVGRWLTEEGAQLIDADEVSRQVTAPGTEVAARIRDAFGEGIVLGDGSIDRAALGRIVFSDPDRLRQLEAIVHPAVRPAILERLADADRRRAPAVAIEAIRLVEGGLADLCDEVWLVECTPDVQRERLQARGLDDRDAATRIAAQTGLADLVRPRARRVIDTSGPAVDVRERVLAAFRDALAGQSTSFRTYEPR